MNNYYQFVSRDAPVSTERPEFHKMLIVSAQLNEDAEALRQFMLLTLGLADKLATFKLAKEVRISSYVYIYIQKNKKKCNGYLFFWTCENVLKNLCLEFLVAFKLDKEVRKTVLLMSYPLG